jgi:NAD(P)-dependent dehydrogenase (short-subunit alcohol dehydrogenase family)
LTSAGRSGTGSSPSTCAAPTTSPGGSRQPWSSAVSVASGFIETDITGGALSGERKAQLIAQIPVGRGGNVADVADLITYLCREESGYITGVTYDVNGGSHIH